MVSSGACGADLIAQSVAKDRKLRRHVVIPYDTELFKVTSVTDRPGNWGSIFDDTVKSDPLVTLTNLSLSPDDESAFVVTNEAIISIALAKSNDASSPDRAPLGVVVWDGASRGAEDVTEHFRRRCIANGIKIVDVATN